MRHIRLSALMLAAGAALALTVTLFVTLGTVDVVLMVIVTAALTGLLMAPGFGPQGC
jgi:hypothetical protein